MGYNLDAVGYNPEFHNSRSKFPFIWDIFELMSSYRWMKNHKSLKLDLCKLKIQWPTLLVEWYCFLVSHKLRVNPQVLKFKYHSWISNPVKITTTMIMDIQWYSWTFKTHKLNYPHKIKQILSVKEREQWHSTNRDLQNLRAKSLRFLNAREQSV